MRIWKLQKKKLKAEMRAKHIEEVNRMQEVLRLQNLLDSMGADGARADFEKGVNGAMVNKFAAFQKTFLCFRQ